MANLHVLPIPKKVVAPKKNFLMDYQRQRILVIENNPALQKLVARALGEQSCDVQVAGGGLEGLALFVEQEPDLILLGADFPDLDGAEVCQRIREYSTIPIIMMLPPNASVNGAIVLNIGADDYLSIPFRDDELLARIQALLRRRYWHEKPSLPGAIRIGDLQINFQAQQLFREEQLVELSQTEWKLLELLVRHSGKVISHDILHRSVWGDTNYRESSNLRRYIHRLRGKLERDPENPRYLVSEQGIGYRFLAPRETVNVASSVASMEERKAPRQTAILPIPPTSFIGWGWEVERVKNMILTKDVRLVTLLGPGGAGKTRLGLQVASHLVENFEHGVCFVALAAIQDSKLVGATIAETLGLEEEKGASIEEVLRGYLADKKLLLVLDNFEQVVLAAPLVADLLETCGGLKVLVTSRSILHIYGEYEFEVPPLALPGTEAISVAEASESPAVALFVERARAVLPGFNLTAQNVAAVVELCVQLDGLPLAIELAAARMKLLSPQAIATRLSNRFMLLTDGAKTLPKRQQTMRNTLDWSYDLLTLDEKVLFARLGVFKGGFTMEAVEVIAGIPFETVGTGKVNINPMEHLSSLLDKSMLARKIIHDEVRFTMLETIHEYARERLNASSEADLLHQRHLSYFLSLAEIANVKLQTDQAQAWVDRLEMEHDNLRSALQWALEREHYQEQGLRLATKLGIFWSGRKYLSEGRRWLDSALSSNNTSPEARARALREAAWLALSQGQTDDAEKFLQLGQSLWGALKNDPHVTYIMAFILEEQGKYGEAILLLQSVLENCRKTDDKKNIDFALHILGQIALKQGDYDLAEGYMQEALAIDREIVKSDIGRSLLTLAHISRLKGNYEKARLQYDDCLAIFREAGMGWGVGHCLLNLGKIAHERGEFNEAQRLFLDTLNLFDELGDYTGLAYCLEAQANLSASQRQVDRAARLWGAAESLRKELNAPLPPADAGQVDAAVQDVRNYLEETGQPDFLFQSAWKSGQKMELAEAVAFARQDAPRSTR